MARVAVTLVLATVLLLSSACTGPHFLRRALDEHENQTYVENPVLAEIAFPLFGLGLIAAAVADYVFVNPIYWWKDVLRGQGTPYYYRNPTVPEEAGAL